VATDPLSVQFGEVKGLLTQVLQQLAAIDSRQREMEATTSRRVGALEREVSELRVRQDAHEKSQSAEQARRVPWTAIAGFVVSVAMVTLAMLSFGDAIGAGR
jgi:hypothetical protein